MPALAARLQNLPPYVFSVINDRTRQLQAEGADIIRLDAGNPDMPPPDAVIERLAQSARQPGNHGYTGYRGISSFRKAVAKYYLKRFGISVDPDTQVLPLLGSKEAIINLTLAYIGKGDMALVPDIGYPAYTMGTQLAEGEVCYFHLARENGFKPNFDEIPVEVAQRAKIMWVNYPNNPTGAVADRAFYEQAAAFCREHDILMASDNPYVDVTFGGYRAGSALEAGTENVVELFSFSKSFNMAGWRLGAAVGSATAINNLLTTKSNIDTGHFHAIYEAGETALETPQAWIDERNAIYQSRRDRILEALPEIGLNAEPVKGSLYVWASTESGDVNAYVEEALVQAHVSMVPGAAYGPGGEGFLRISIAVEDNRLDQALQRLRIWYPKANL